MSARDIPHAPDALQRMAALPPFASRPAWLTDLDAALAAWIVASIADDRIAATRAALAALERVLALPLDDDALTTPRDFLDAQVAAIRTWLADPSPANQHLASSTYDATRQLHAWRDFPEIAEAWVTEVADFAIHTVWSGALTSYISPPAPSQCAALAGVCAARGLACTGIGADSAVLEVARAMSGRR